MQRLVAGGVGWIIVQPGRYRYLAVAKQAVMIKMVLSEYLACEVIWDQEGANSASDIMKDRKISSERSGWS